jgi:transketolase
VIERGFIERSLDDATADELAERARLCRGAVLTMTSLAQSGHPGGSLSSMELLLVLYHFARLRPAEPDWPGRDRVVVSHGHVSPGVYTALADAGFFGIDEAVAHFRQAGSPFEGHVERSVPGVEWSTGNLGQGLSAGVGFALGARMTGGAWHTFVAMSDGEQNKGQVAEARRLALKHGLADLTVVVDVNGVQISGATAEVMPVDIAAGFEADGWGVVEVDGHDVRALYETIAGSFADTSGPVAVLAHTRMGKGVSFMEDRAEYHGRALTADEYARAMEELGLPPDVERFREMRARPVAVPRTDLTPPALTVAPGTPRTYDRAKDTDCRTAWGAALVGLAEANPALPMAVFDCDLAVSVKTDAFAAARPDGFVECGVGEHDAAGAASALSVTPALTFWADFGVFGIDEVYNQLRLADINHASLKLVLTHCGLDVGEDGRTHQCVDYVGALRDLFGWKVVVPADPNQTDRVVRAVAGVAVVMGRGKLPVVLAEDGTPLFAGAYVWRYGGIDWARSGADATVLVMGTPAGAAVDAADALAADGIAVSVGIVSCPLALEHAAMERAAAPLLLTVEDHSVRSGLGASVAEWLAANRVAARLVRRGVTGYQSSGAAKDLYAIAGLDAAGIALAIKETLAGEQ